MKKNVIGITSELNKGYTASIKALVSLYKNSKTMDFQDPSLVSEIVSAVDSLDIISCADFGITAFTGLLKNESIASRYENGEIRFILSSDRYYDVSLKPFYKGINLILPKEAATAYLQQYPELLGDIHIVDIVASSVKEDMEKAGEAFEADNSRVRDIIFENDIPYFFFLGGRVQTGPGEWKENTVEIFKDEAINLLEIISGNNCFIGTHGLRTFTSGDGMNDFKPFNAFVEELQSGLNEEQTIFMLAQRDCGEKSRKPAFITITKDDISSFDMENVGSSYYYALDEAVRTNAHVIVTVEQMNFISEFFSYGGDLLSMTPSYWPLSVPSNVETYKGVMDKFNKGEEIYDARTVWAKWM